MSFTSLQLSTHLLQALNYLGYEKPFPIQEAAIPAIFTRKDVLGIAPTGSGKTVAYLLPILSLLEKFERPKNRHIQILIVVPTRELAIQIQEVAKIFCKALPYHVKSLAVFGGVSIQTQMQELQDVQVLIATPGRLLELVDSNALHLSQLEILVLDEADKILNLGFKKEMNQVFRLLPTKRQNILFSATLSEDLEGLNQVLLHEPTVVKTEAEELTIENIQQSAYLVSEERRGPLLRYLIKSRQIPQVLIFCSSVYEADNVTDKLCKNGIEARAIHSKKSQLARTDALLLFKQDKVRVLVATDLISRGIDIPALPLVINYELPRSPKDYIHRIGRTGRASATGEAISLVIPSAEHHFKVIQKKMKKSVETIDSSIFDLKGF